MLIQFKKKSFMTKKGEKKQTCLCQRCKQCSDLVKTSKGLQIKRQCRCEGTLWEQEFGSRVTYMLHFSTTAHSYSSVVMLLFTLLFTYV